MSVKAWKSPTFMLTVLAVFLLTSAFSHVAATNFSLPRQQSSEQEPNDTPAQANTIEVNVNIVGTVPASNPSDTDYFVLNSEPGRQYEVRLDEAPVSGDYRFALALYDNNENLLNETETPGGNTSLTWTANSDTYYFSVKAVSIGSNDAPYEIRVIRFGLTPTATSPPSWDSCEINDSLGGTWSSSTPPGGPCPISVGATVEDLNFVPYSGQPSPNPDYFLVSVKGGRNYRLETQVTAGVDTVVYLYPPDTIDDSQYIAVNDDAPGLGLGSRIEWTPPADGAYLIKIENREPLPHESNETYDLLVRDTTPTPTATHTPPSTTSTPTGTPPPVSVPGSPDAFEPNYDFSRATLIGLDTKYTGLNFVPWTGSDIDTDFYKLWVVAGKLYTCETLELGTATNTNIIFCSGKSWEQCFAGNDNVEPFDPNDPYRSRLKFFSTYDGYLYLVIGQVGAAEVLPEEWKNLNYSLRCYIEMPGTATPTPTGDYVPPASTATPQPTSAADTPQPSPTLAQIVVRPMTTPPPPPTAPPAVTPTAGLYVVNLSIYYDRNVNGVADAGEGISDVLARAYNVTDGKLLSIDYTDEQGAIRFSLPTTGPVRVSVPFFSFNQVVTSNDAHIPIRISPRP